MANNMSSRQACHAARYVVARVLRGLFWCLKYTVILPLATMALMALFVLWKDNTTPGKLLVKEINFVRQTAPAGQFPVSECWFSSSDSSGRSEIQGNATTSDTCMTMEQANEKAKKLERSSEAKPVAASLPRLAEGNFRTMPVQTVTATTPSGSRPAVTAHPEQKLLAPRPLFTAAREVKTVVPVSSVTPVTPPRPLRTGEQTAALWIAPYIDNQDVYHQPSSVFFVIKPSAWGKPRIN
ncbi:type IV conjugative transfer system lipoprotein TraV [Escherichia coli]|nr:type IV conjugative transfer system lipoprotein TraV [Escherichia coli]